MECLLVCGIESSIWTSAYQAVNVCSEKKGGSEAPTQLKI